MATSITDERRIGKRRGVEPVRVGWMVDRPERVGRRLRRRLAGMPGHGVLLDVSVSGAQVLAPADPEIRIGTRFDIEVKGVVGRVVVRRIVHSATPDLCLYGVEIPPESGDLARLFSESLFTPYPRPNLLACR